MSVHRAFPLLERPTIAMRSPASICILMSCSATICTRVGERADLAGTHRTTAPELARSPSDSASMCRLSEYILRGRKSFLNDALYTAQCSNGLQVELPR